MSTWKPPGWSDDPRQGNCFGYDVAEKFLDDNGYDMKLWLKVIESLCWGE